MPAFLELLLPAIVRITIKIGLPLLEREWPAVKPVADEILKLIAGTVDEPSDCLQSAAAHYNALNGAK